jgi:hypothetical protein
MIISLYHLIIGLMQIHFSRISVFIYLFYELFFIKTDVRIETERAIKKGSCNSYGFDYKKKKKRVD